MRTWFNTAAILISMVLSTAAGAADVSIQGSYIVSGGNAISWAYPFIKLDAARNQGYTGKGVTVGVFDTGLDTTSYKFTGNIAGPGYDIYTGKGVTNDPNWHGTFVSSIIAANTTTNNTIGMYGVASSAKILPIRVMDSTGKGTFTDIQLANGINYAITNGAKVFNNSWNSNLTLADLGAYRNSLMSWYPKQIAAYETASSKGIINVWAAGNSGLKDPGYYATLPAVDPKLAGSWIVAVAVDGTGKIASYSNRCGIAASYCLAAPGSDIVGVYQKGVAVASGTSFAAPIISGAAAILLQEWPYLSGAQITGILFNSANKTGVYADKSTYGQGMLDLNAATKPQGTLAVPTSANVTQGATTSLAQSVVVLPSAVGTISMPAQQMAVVDSFNRAYMIDVGNMVTRAPNLLDIQQVMEKFDSDAIITDTSGIRLSLSMDANDVKTKQQPLPLGGVGNPWLSMGQGRKMAASGFGITTWSGQGNETLTGTPSYSGAMYNIGPVQVGLLHEDKSVLGTPSLGGYGLAQGADSAFAAFNKRWNMLLGLDLDTMASVGYTKLQGTAGMAAKTDSITTAAFGIGVSRANVFTDTDRLGITWSIPNHSIGGTARMTVPATVDADGNIGYQSVKINLASKTPEQDVQAYWTTELSNQARFSIAAGVRLQPDSVTKSSAQGIGMARFSLRF